ncbi:uncharacterized protein LOC130636092 [Hydractinia symbiolongicarpus]|uniref:uncharacterized protein LOC130636092 n=1 Tax=Hydractinia symbiolongicarpus TaxID=13093 RepID=UPI00254DAC68|nr:uncharacterized protein LOC130636092 [Hydractinia symbiolongicarpus]XP_057301678.1 uncharacterized protein LOC130636092 [Hydractinia symbiolongicarpus]XP_057301679.1 uncharacterized protein LOC130636092 [Hydractinia symbiolongicarpus]
METSLAASEDVGKSKSEDHSIFLKPLTLEVYQQILNVILLDSDFSSELSDYDDHILNEIPIFYKKYKRNFFINNNKNMRKFQLKLKDGELERFHTGIPKLQVCIYNRKTKITTWQELVPQEYAEKILEKLHQIKIDTERMTCHPNSINKLTKKFNDTYYFRGINELARVFLKNCPTCKVSNPLPQTELPPPIPIRTFWPHQRLQFDLILLAVNKRKYLSNNIWGFKHILTVKCTFSKYIWLFPIISKEAEHIYTSLRFLCEKEGFPEIFQSDNGKEFVAKIITDFLKTHDVQIKHGRPYHPQSQGQVENANKVVKSHLNRILQHMTKDESFYQVSVAS